MWSDNLLPTISKALALGFKKVIVYFGGRGNPPLLLFYNVIIT